MHRDVYSRIDELVGARNAGRACLILALMLILLISSCSDNPSKPVTPISVSVVTVPEGLSITVDGRTYAAPRSFSWAPGSTHTVATTPTHSPDSGTQHSWSSWSDGAGVSHSVSPTTDTLYTATFTTQYRLTTATYPTGSGTISLDPIATGNWYNAGQQVQIQTTSETNYNFMSWTGSGSGSYSGPDNPINVVMNAPLAQTANFAGATISVTVQTWPPGQVFTVDASSYSSHQTFNWVPGTTHTLATTSPQLGGPETRYIYSGWSDGGGIDHSVSPTTDALYTAYFTTQYQLTTAINPSGIGTVSLDPTTNGNWYDAAQQVQVQANPGANYSFLDWTGSGSGSYTGPNNPAIVVMNAPITESASFYATSAGSVIVESKSFALGSNVCQVGVYITNPEPIVALVLPLEIREVTPGAFPATSLTFQGNPSGRVQNSPLGPEGLTWPPAVVTSSRYAVTATTPCSGPTSSSYATAAAQIDFVSPDAVFYAAVSSGDPGIGQSISLPPGSDPLGVPSFWFTFGITTTPGIFVIDTCCIRPGSHLAFVNEAITIVVPQFVRGFVAIYAE